MGKRLKVAAHKPSLIKNMKTPSLIAGFIVLGSTLFTLPVVAATAEARNQWPQWRGPLATGVAPEADPPLEWSETKNVKWKAKIPGQGTATPVIWGDRVFILTAIGPEKQPPAEPSPAPAAPPPPKVTGTDTNATPAGSGEGRRRRGPGGPGGPGGGGGFGRSEKPTEKFQFVVLCLDRKTGQPLWQKTATEEVPHEGHHRDHGFASASPVTDGQVVLAYFGSRGLHCYDLEGNFKWSKQFGQLQTRNGFGEGASPALHGDTVVVVWDGEGKDDFITALDKRTGKELWRTPRNEDTGWSTPLIVEQDKKTQVIVNASGKVRSYDLTTGQEIWNCGGQTGNAIPSPVADATTVYLTSGFRGSALFAIKLGATGDLDGTEAVRWSYNKNTPYVPSPLLTGGWLYLVSGNNGKLTCFDTKTGQPQFEAEQLPGIFGIYASPVAAKDRVYVLGREGKCLVLQQGPKFDVLATNTLDDRTDASIALVGKELFIRGQQNLYCIGAN